MKSIYFDNGATTFPKPEIVYRFMDEVSREYGVNAGRGSYNLANRAGILIEETRVLLAKMVNLPDHRRIIFTPSATIALNNVLFGLDLQTGDNVYISPFEHNSVLRPLEVLRHRLNLNIIEIPLNKDSLAFDLDKLQELFSVFKPRLMVINHASNVCGVIAPIKELTILAHKYGSQVLVDGAQAIGLLPLDIQEVDCDYYVFAGHKNLYGPLGIGGVIINNEDLLTPFIVGGTGINSEELVMPEEYPYRLEAGSPNIIAIAGLNAGIRWLKGQKGLLEKEQELFSTLLQILESFPEINVIGKTDIENMLPVVSCTFDGYTPQEMAMILDQNFNIAVRAGLHCAPLAHKFLGTFPLGTVRFSIGYFNNTQDVEYLEESLHRIYY